MAAQTSNDPMITEFFFIRHAPIVKDQSVLPAYDPPISAGPFPTAVICQTLPKEADWHISPMQRTKQTAALFRECLRPRHEHQTDALIEQNFGQWHEMAVRDVWEQIKEGPRHNWGFLMPGIIPPNGESFDEQIDRVAAWCAQIEAEKFDRPQIVFTHAGTMRAALAHMLELSSVQAQSLAIPHFGCLHVHLMHAAQHHGGAWQIQALRPLLR